MIYKLYTDGATTKNGFEGAYGGYAWALIANDKLIREGSGGESPTTNNICELKAMINGCEEARNWIEPFDTVLVYSDSAYIINCYKQSWYKAWERTVKNFSLLQVCCRREKHLFFIGVLAISFFINTCKL